MEKLGAELDGCGRARIAVREDAPADAVARFEDFCANAALAQGAGGGESGRACADDDDLGLSRGAQRTSGRRAANIRFPTRERALPPRPVSLAFALALICLSTRIT